MSYLARDLAAIDRALAASNPTSAGAPRFTVRRKGRTFALTTDHETIGRFSSREAARAAARARAQEASAEQAETRGGCYRTKREAAKAFLDYPPNEAIADDFGGRHMPATGGEFDPVNEYTARVGKRRASTLQQAVEAAIPAGKPPYCLSDVRLDLLNETAPAIHGREGRGFSLPEDAAEMAAAAAYERGGIEASEAERGPAHHGRPSARKPSVTQKVFKGGRIPAAGPHGPGFPLSGYQCEDDQGRIVPCGDARAVGRPVRVKYRPELPGGERPTVYLRPGDKVVAEEARSRADREDLRRAAGAVEAAKLDFPFGGGGS